MATPTATPATVPRQSGHVDPLAAATARFEAATTNGLWPDDSPACCPEMVSALELD